MRNQGEDALGNEFVHRIFDPLGIAVVGKTSGKPPQDAGLGFDLP